MLLGSCRAPCAGRIEMRPYGYGFDGAAVCRSPRVSLGPSLLLTPKSGGQRGEAES